MKPSQAKRLFIELRAKDTPFEEIANQTGVGVDKLIAWSEEYQTDIANLKAVELDAIQAQFASKRKRIETVGKTLEAVSAEIEDRVKNGLADVPTDKLIDLQVKLGKMMREEETRITFTRTQDSQDIDFSSKVSWGA